MPNPLLSPERVLRRMEWKVVRRLEGLLQGEFHTLLRGTGTDFLDLRDYQWGDDVRHIDWNVTARMDELFVRDFMEDRELTAWLLLDRSRSMTFGTVERTKERVLSELAAAVSQLLVRGGNRVGAVISDGMQEWSIPPGQGRNQVLSIVKELLRPLYGPQLTDLGKLLETAARLARRRSLVVLVSDFISQPGWERPLGRLSQRHEVVAIRLFDPHEYELPDAGMLFVQDAESGDQLLIDSSDPEFRRRLREAGWARDESIRQGVARARVRLHTLSTEDDLLSALLRIAASGRPSRR